MTRKVWQMTRYPGDKARLNFLSAELKRLLFNDRNAGIQKYLKNLDAIADYSLWKAIGRLKRSVLH